MHPHIGPAQVALHGQPGLPPTPEELAALSRYLMQQKQARLAAKAAKTRRKKGA
jgi:hypothetical protein